MEDDIVGAAGEERGSERIDDQGGAWMIGAGIADGLAKRRVDHGSGVDS